MLARLQAGHTIRLLGVAMSGEGAAEADGGPAGETGASPSRAMDTVKTEGKHLPRQAKIISEDVISIEDFLEGM